MDREKLWDYSYRASIFLFYFYTFILCSVLNMFILVIKKAEKRKDDRPCLSLADQWFLTWCVNSTHAQTKYSKLFCGYWQSDSEVCLGKQKNQNYSTPKEKEVPHFQTHYRTSEIKMGVVLAERADKSFNGQNGETKP